MASQCPKHGSQLNLYCQPCKSLTCPSCTEHKGDHHETENLDSVLSEQKEVFESVLNGAKNEELSCKHAIQELTDLKENVAKSLAEENKVIDRVVETRISEILQEAQALKIELQNIGKAKVDKIDQEIDRFEKRANKLENVCDEAEETMSHSPHLYVTQHDSLIQKMKLVTDDGLNAVVVDKNPHAATFVKETGKGAKSPRLGKLLKVVSPRKLQIVQELENFQDAYKVALLSNNMLAICDSYYGSKQVMIYHKQNSSYTKKMTLNLHPSNRWGPKAIIFSGDGNFLIARKVGIEVYSPEGEYLKTITTRSKELSDDDVDISSITTLSDGRFLAGDIDRSMITEHDSLGKLIWMVRTKIRPYYIAAIQDRYVAISDHTKNKVIILDVKSGKEILEKEIPLVQGICYDEHTDSLLVVRNEGSQYQQPISRTGVVEQYCCSTGRLVNRLAHGLYYPKGLALSTDAGMLVVADQSTVKLYRMS